MTATNMPVLCRSLRSIRCAVTFAILFFLGGCLLGILKLSRVDIHKDLLLNHENKEASPDGKGLWMQALKEHMNKEPMLALNNLTKGGQQFLDGIKGRINKTMTAADKLKKKYIKDPTTKVTREKELLPNYNIHAFYYPWYGNPEHDGVYLHWNHDRLPHWNAEIAKKWPQNPHVPPDDIGSNFYPELGCYSSRDPVIIDEHMQQFREAGIGVLVVSWYPPGKADNQGHPSNDIIPELLSTAQKYKIKVAFHSEPYKERTQATFIEDVKYLIDTYGTHPAFYRRNHRGHDLPLIYVYDSYLTKAKDWAKVLKGSNSIRNTIYNAIFIGLLVEQKDSQELHRAGFDGFYTYFASNAFTFGSKWQNWRGVAAKAKQEHLLFIPSVGPGYVDNRVRPWNDANTRSRKAGRYYKLAFEAAMKVEPEIISITSFNEWHEGTQIERAVPKSIRSMNYTYEDYTPSQPDYYLKLTKVYTDIFERSGKVWTGG